MDDQRPTGTLALALELDALRERTHVRNPNPGSRRARLAGAVHSDDRHLDPGTGKFVTVAVALNYRTFPGEQRVEVLVDLIRKSAIHTVDFSRLAQIIAASGERAFHLANLSQARTAALVRTRLPTQTGMRSTWMA